MRIAKNDAQVYEHNGLTPTAVLNDCYSEGTTYTTIGYSYQAIVFATRMDAYVAPPIDIDHSCHIKAIELI